MKAWRLLPTDRTSSCFKQMAIDEAVLHCVGKGLSPNTLWFYSMKKPSVAIGLRNSSVSIFAVRRCVASFNLNSCFLNT